MKLNIVMEFPQITTPSHMPLTCARKVKMCVTWSERFLIFKFPMEFCHLDLCPAVCYVAKHCPLWGKKEVCFIFVTQLYLSAVQKYTEVTKFFWQVIASLDLICCHYNYCMAYQLRLINFSWVSSVASFKQKSASSCMINSGIRPQDTDKDKRLGV